MSMRTQSTFFSMVSFWDSSLIREDWTLIGILLIQISIDLCCLVSSTGISRILYLYLKIIFCKMQVICPNLNFL